MRQSGEHLRPTAPPLGALAAQVERCMLRDRRTLHSQIQKLQDQIRARRPVDRWLHRLASDISRSVAQRQQRQAQLPRPTFPAELPVAERREEISQAIKQHPVVIVCGETGSGKTTQLPKICLELGRGAAGLIGHTQPRRIAARAVAMRISQELDSPLGQAVGYKVRFSDKLSDRTCIKLMTDGILLAETQGDLYLEQYDTIIIDEAHERSLNIDFLLGYLKQLMPRRPDLKLIITSATINPEQFSKHFNNAPIVMVSGRTYPVEVRYRPIVTQEDDPDEDEPTLQEAILAAVDELTWRSHERIADPNPSSLRRFVAPSLASDILIFLSGEREIRETAESLRKHHPSNVEVLPLYARLSAEEQMKVFRPGPHRRIVLATNVAETSLTVPRIGYVIDPGFARISRYSTRTKVQRLPIEPISRASADQRKGRCGRIAEGICIRLYSELDFNARTEFTDPEIRRTHLASVILQMKALKLGDIQEFPFLDPPDYRAIRDGYQTLHELGAIDETNELTDAGWQLSRLPVDPRIGRMILAAREENCLDEVLIIASALSVQDPRERPLERQQEADIAHARFRDPSSDFLSFVKLWDWYHESARQVSSSKLRRLCQESFLSFVRMREWNDIHQQLRGLLRELPTSAPATRNLPTISLPRR